MPGEMIGNFKKLEAITKKDLAIQFNDLKGFAEDSLKLANKCDINLALKDLALAELAAHRLRQDADLYRSNGSLTGDEYHEITELTTSLVFENLVEDLSNAITNSCQCARGPGYNTVK